MKTMMRWIAAHKIATALLGVIVLVCAWLFCAWPRGAIMAHVDHIRGHAEIKTFGLPASWRGEYGRLLQEKYNVKLNTVAGCCVTPGLVSYVGGYNQVAKWYAIRRIGKDVFQECAEQARINWEVKHRANQVPEDTRKLADPQH